MVALDNLVMQVHLLLFTLIREWVGLLEQVGLRVIQANLVRMVIMVQGEQVDLLETQANQAKAGIMARVVLVGLLVTQDNQGKVELMVQEEREVQQEIPD